MRSRYPVNSPLGRAWGELSAKTLARMNASAQIAAVYADDFLALVKRRIGETCTHPERIRAMRRHASTAVNVARTMTDGVATCYAQGCRRYLADAAEPQARAFADLVSESGVQLQQSAVNSSAWLCGPTLVMPHVDAATHELQLSAIRPDEYDAQLGPGRSLLGVLWRCADALQWVHVDALAWTYYDEDGKPTGERVEHGLGYVPAAVFRSVPELWGGFWAASAGPGLLQASLDAALVYSTMRYFRMVQAGFLTVVASESDKVTPGASIAEVEVPLHFNAPAGDVRVDVLSRDLSVDNFLKDIRAIVAFQAVQHGIPPSELDFSQDSSNWGALSLSLRTEKLAHLRGRQVPHLLRAERDLWPMVADVVRQSSHSLAAALPEHDALVAALRVEFPEVEGTSDPIKRLDVYEREVAAGFTSDVAYMQARKPELTAAEARAQIDADRERHYAALEAATKRNLPADPSNGVRTVAELQGQLGGLTRAANAQQEPTT